MKKIDLMISTCFDCPYVRLHSHMDIVFFFCFKCKTKEDKREKFLYEVCPSVDWDKGEQIKIPDWCPLEEA